MNIIIFNLNIAQRCLLFQFWRKTTDSNLNINIGIRSLNLQQFLTPKFYSSALWVNKPWPRIGNLPRLRRISMFSALLPNYYILSYVFEEFDIYVVIQTMLWCYLLRLKKIGSLFSEVLLYEFLNCSEKR